MFINLSHFFLVSESISSNCFTRFNLSQFHQACAFIENESHSNEIPLLVMFYSLVAHSSVRLFNITLIIGTRSFMPLRAIKFLFYYIIKFRTARKKGNRYRDHVACGRRGEDLRLCLSSPRRQLRPGDQRHNACSSQLAFECWFIWSHSPCRGEWEERETDNEPGWSVMDGAASVRRFLFLE